MEDGYTRIANPIMDALCCADFNAREFRVVNFVIRETYGWQVKQKRMSGEYIAKKVKLDPSRCSKVLNELIRREVIIRHGGSRSPVSLNKNVDDWKPRVGSKRQPPTRCAESAQDEPSQSAQDEPTYKDRKDILEPKGSKKSSKKSSPNKWGEEIDHQLAEWMGEIVDSLPGGKSNRNLTSWANTIRLMRTRDERDPAHIKKLFEWASQNKFWQGNIHSPQSLRDQWKKLAIQRNNEKSSEGSYANRQGFDQQRSERDRIAQRLADPNDSGWIDGLFDEEGSTADAGEPDFYPAGGDLPQDMANGFQYGSDADFGETGSGAIDGEVVGSSHEPSGGYGNRADQDRGRRMAAERGSSGQEPATATGGFWNA